MVSISENWISTSPLPDRAGAGWSKPKKKPASPPKGDPESELFFAVGRATDRTIPLSVKRTIFPHVNLRGHFARLAVRMRCLDLAPRTRREVNRRELAAFGSGRGRGGTTGRGAQDGKSQGKAKTRGRLPNERDPQCFHDFSPGNSEGARLSIA